MCPVPLLCEQCCSSRRVPLLSSSGEAGDFMQLSRRTFLGNTITAGITSGLLLQRPTRAAETTTTPSNRKMTIDLSCGNIGVQADQRQAIDYAHKHGFESV